MDDIGDRQIVVAVLKIVIEPLIENNKFRAVRMRSGIAGPVRRDFAGKGAVAGEDQDGWTIGVHGLARKLSWRRVGMLVVGR